MKNYLCILFILLFPLFIYSQKVEVDGDIDLLGKIEMIKAVGDSSIFIGANAGLNDFGGRLNTFVGNNAGMSNVGGLWNTFLGYNAGKNSSASGNTFVGRAAGFNSAGYSNLFLGNNTGRDNTGFENTMVGAQSGFFSDGSGHVFLGAFAGLGETGDNKLYIDNSNTSTPLIYGEFDNDLVRINGKLELTLAPSNPLDAATKAYVDLLETTINVLEAKVLLLTYVLNLTVQQRLDWGDTPIEIYNSDNSLLDSLYGKTYQGGLIAYLNTTTGTGLIATPVDQSSGAGWGCLGVEIGGTSSAIGVGQANTTLIVNGCADSGIAARLCDDLDNWGYDDWFLPSKDELNELYGNLKVNGFGGFSSVSYWSSTEVSSNWAEYQIFDSGVQSFTNKSGNNGVRGVRAF